MFPYTTSRPAPRMGGGERPERPAAVAPPTLDVRTADRERRPWRDRVRRAVDLTVAFVLLEDAEGGREPTRTEALAHHDPPGHSPPHKSVDVAHPHRKPLRPSPRPRRPGAVPPPQHVCTTPLVPEATRHPQRSR